jgi:hypothetical protein
MKTVIFILALTAIAAPVFTAAGDAIACTANPTNCNFCQKDAAGAATAFCYDCKAGYYLSTAGVGTSACTRCGTGLGKAAGTATAASLEATRPNTVEAATTCTACHASCAECWAPASATGCARCAGGMYATVYAAGTGATCTACASTKGRAAGAADLTAVEADTVCSVTCATGIANCKGAAATDANWCLANYWWAAGSCTACTDSKTKAAGTAMPTAAETAAACTAPAATTTTTAKSATLIQALCGASVAAYALF